ncbi:MAG: hypothetical protein IJS13_05620 [Paludibacteraceae bacterium]|nr:hypothetical protein [Paludibacteraceae bacterium]
MKRNLLFFISLIVFSSCVKHIDVQTIAEGTPITPVQCTGEQTIVQWTDYLPVLSPLSKNLEVHLSGEYKVQSLSKDSITFSGNVCTPELLQVSEGHHILSIPVLPALPYSDGLTSFSVIDDEVTIGFHGSAAKELAGSPAFIMLVQNTALDKDVLRANSDGSWTIQLRFAPKYAGRSFLRVYASDERHRFNDLLIPLEDGKPVVKTTQLTRHDDNAQILYSLMVDRFADGNIQNNAPLNRVDVLPQVDYQGGDIAGVTQKIRDGFFDSLHINTIWLSPLSQNPTTPWGLNKEPFTRFSGYHGYWPVYNTALDTRMGTADELNTLLCTAHEHGINVILDYVANHLHIESPTLKEHPDWITDSILPDGRRNFELWDECRLTTWFDAHIPTLDLEREDVCDAMTDTALYWMQTYDFDGYRHDACKHIPLNYWRMFTHKLKTRMPDRHFWMIGETYGSPELIASYVKSGMLNAQFDFTIYHTAIEVLGQQQSMRRLADAIDEACEYYGAHHTMGNISGNHDKCRFISLAGGAVDWNEDDKHAGWTRKIGITADGDTVKEERAFKKALLLEVINMTIPGVPCIYQGDEYGQAGANDPDNRRMMRFSGLNKREQQMRQEVEKLTALRRNSMPLIYGDYCLLFCDRETIVFSRTYLGDTMIIGINNGESDRDLSIEGMPIHIDANGYTIL